MRSEKAFAVTNTGDIKMSGKFLARASALSLAVFLVACGGDDGSTPIVNINTGQDDTSTGGAGATNPDGSSDDTSNPDANPGDGTSEIAALLGTGSGSSFIEGQLFVSPSTVEVDESLAFQVTLAHPETKQPWLRSGQNVSYTSPCIDAGIANISGPSSPDSGIILANYTSTGCYGTDLVHAFIGNSSTPAASGTITIHQPGSLELALADYNPTTNSITAAGAIHSTSSSISKYGQTRLTVGIIDLYDESSLQAGMPFTVNFSAFCADGQNSSSFNDTSVTTTSGIAETIFTAGNCTQNPQTIIATLEDSEGKTSIATVAINVDESKAFQLVAALPEPMSIAPSFLSEEGRETVSTVRFTLKDQFGDAGDGMPLEDVTFTIDSPNTAEFVDQTTGDAVNSITVNTNTDGVATAQVRAKQVVDHEEFRIIATYDCLTTYSMPIVINSMLPFEPKFSLSVGNFAPDTWQKNGVQSDLTLYVADIFGERVRGNTYVNFQTDQGSIDPECVVVDGRCSITWESLLTDGPIATVTASTHGRKEDGELGTITTTARILMSTNENVTVELDIKGTQDVNGTEYCAIAYVELPNQIGTFSPPVGTTFNFELVTGEFTVDAVESETIASKSSLVDATGYEVCTKVKPQATEEADGSTSYDLELWVTVQTPQGGATDSDNIFWN